MRDERDFAEGSPEYWRAMHARLVREGRLDAGAYLDLHPDGAADLAPAPDPLDALNRLEAAAWLEEMKNAAALVDQAAAVADAPDEPAFVAELEQLRAEARTLFIRKFFEVN